ncbi:hypothetical protein EN830_34005, partial [Mesorhizobium sp. M1C.F.Ca.ET.187.01.1.1]
VPTRLVRVPYGETLMWEVHTRMEYQAGLYERLVDAGAEFGIRDVGSRALTAIRTEAGFPLLGNRHQLWCGPTRRWNRRTAQLLQAGLRRKGQSNLAL